MSKKFNGYVIKMEIKEKTNSTDSFGYLSFKRLNIKRILETDPLDTVVYMKKKILTVEQRLSRKKRRISKLKGITNDDQDSNDEDGTRKKAHNSK